MPLARGRVSFIRKVDDQGYIRVNAQVYFVGKRHARRYLTATAYTHRQILVIKSDRNVLKQFPFPIHETLILPLVQASQR